MQVKRMTRTCLNCLSVQELSLPPVKLHCSMLAEDAIKAALNDFKLKQARFANM